MTDRLFLIDGHALIFKMYYAFLRKPMINSKGEDMSILFGFTKYILELIEREKPTHIAVAFDPPGGTFRNRMFPQYKANRAETPQLVIDALQPLTNICHALNITTLMVMDYEADDVIGTVAKRFQSDYTQVFMVTPDKDYGQLIDNNIFQLKPGKSGGNDELIGIKEICEKYGIQNPSQVVEILTICGDSADNVPGVNGIGEKGAQKLIDEFGSVENVYANIDKLSDRQRAMLEEARPHIGLSHELVTINTAVPVSISKDDMLLKIDFRPDAAALFDKYEFNSLKKYLGQKGQYTIEKYKKIAFDKTPFSELCRKAIMSGRCSITTKTQSDSIFSNALSMTVAVKENQKYYVAEASLADFKSLMENKDVEKCGYNLKYQYNILSHNCINIKGRLLDIELMHYLVNPEKSHKIEVLAKSYLDISIEEYNEIEQLNLFDTVPEIGHSDMSKEAVASLMLCEKISEEMHDVSITTLYDKIEEPLIRVLGKMEQTGVNVDIKQLKSYAKELHEELSSREATIRDMAGEPHLNISSPKQIGEVLFDKMAIDSKAKKTGKGSYSTDENTLLSIAYKHPIINEILEFRTVKKLLSTYIEPFPEYVSKDTGRIHTTFNQALTATGRLSSSNPNLQNIPIRTERGKEIRKAFIPSVPGGLIVSADYSQIELRIMAHLCGDEHLTNAFKEGIDVHAATASKIFNIDYSSVTPYQRRIAKTANFGIMYGISAFGLAQKLHIARGEANKLIDDYFKAFPSIKTYISNTIETAREKGYVETLFGRRRYLPDLKSKNANVRSLAERNAVNAPIQGSAADIIKLAMIGVDKRINEAGLKSKMVLQIHDELVFDAIGTEVEALKRLVTDEMENVVCLNIPLTVECNYGQNWLEAH
ncbi:MAG: DNA polymerase I [Candidatus Cryptobacteroides sp.]